MWGDAKCLKKDQKGNTTMKSVFKISKWHNSTVGSENILCFTMFVCRFWQNNWNRKIPLKLTSKFQSEDTTIYKKKLLKLTFPIKKSTLKGLIEDLVLIKFYKNLVLMLEQGLKSSFASWECVAKTIPSWLYFTHNLLVFPYFGPSIISKKFCKG